MVWPHSQGIPAQRAIGIFVVHMLSGNCCLLTANNRAAAFLNRVKCFLATRACCRFASIGPKTDRLNAHWHLGFRCQIAQCLRSSRMLTLPRHFDLANQSFLVILGRFRGRRGLSRKKGQNADPARSALASRYAGTTLFTRLRTIFDCYRNKPT